LNATQVAPGGAAGLAALQAPAAPGPVATKEPSAFNVIPVPEPEAVSGRPLLFVTLPSTPGGALAYSDATLLVNVTLCATGAAPWHAAVQAARVTCAVNPLEHGGVAVVMTEPLAQ
jgi:hypothetical protein